MWYTSTNRLLVSYVKGGSFFMFARSRVAFNVLVAIICAIIYMDGSLDEENCLAVTDGQGLWTSRHSPK